MRPARRTNRRRITEQPTRKRPPDGGRFHAFEYQRQALASAVHREPDRQATATATITAHTTGETFLLLPLRGESLAAWLNSVFIA